MNDWAEFRHFKYLLAILEYKGFRAASEHVHTAEPNLSVQAKQFQENFGIRLFKKASNGRIQLTATGVAFKAIARDLLKARDEAIAALIAVERGESTRCDSVVLQAQKLAWVSQKVECAAFWHTISYAIPFEGIEGRGDRGIWSRGRSRKSTDSSR